MGFGAVHDDDCVSVVISPRVIVGPVIMCSHLRLRKRQRPFLVILEVHGNSLGIHIVDMGRVIYGLSATTRLESIGIIPL